MPGCEAAHHKGTCQDIYIPFDRCIGDIEGASELRVVQDIAMNMRQHLPKPAHGLRRDIYTKLRNISLEKGADILLTPQSAVAILAC